MTMQHDYVTCTSFAENEQHGVQSQEKILISNGHPGKPWQPARSKIRGCLRRVQTAMLSLAGLEWYCYAALGVLTALMSFCMDLTIAKLLRAHQWLYGCLEGNILLQFLCWTLYPTCLCALSTSFSHSICPQSAGSGLPEIRTILSGVHLPDYLSLSNLFAKLIGLISTLSAGSTVFLGKVGPFVHLSNMLGAYLYRLYATACGDKQIRSQGEMLVVASAVGVASCFGAPISGVLFSIEVMGSHYSIRDYCPCFFAAVCGSLTYRLLSVFSREQETVQAVFKTRFPSELPYQPPEILIFAFLGLLCGAISCVYLYSHRWILRFVRTNKFISRVMATEKTLYSATVAFLLASVTFPHTGGFFIASQLWLLVLACTLPLPAGYFMPVFIYGAALGRLLGEGLAYLFPDGISSGERLSVINPGGYALVGAAAFAGAVTHTLSPALCALELTGQSTHVIPILTATLISNALARSRHQPSFYDGISLIKRLPHLPSLIRACPKLSSIQIRQFVVPVGAVLQRAEGVTGVQHVLNSSKENEFPVVDTHDSFTLLGTVTRAQLQTFLLSNQSQDLCKSLEDECSIQPVKLQLSTDATVKQAHCIMSVLREQCVFVTEMGKLHGVITWKEMKNMIEDLAKEI
ncbi:chloride channel K isoform X2 [Tachysurus vachellii]|uniref:chloride channel K isoform X2 n=1 Tax=Tachysurus vachellii TaxID=175792 RepID=UPI00296B57F0|nr:chloride channel K isoform X2 [Tachysurus vachellii]